MSAFTRCIAFACLSASATAQTVFSTNFDIAIPPEIAAGTATLTAVQGFAGLGPIGNTIGGTFLRSPTGNTITLSLSGLPVHDVLHLDFLLAAIDSLDGAGPYPAGDWFTIGIDGTTVFRETFANASPFQVQTYVPPAGVELARLVDLGFSGPGSPFLDSAYWLGGDPYCAAFAHTGTTATITFAFAGPGQALTDESWALDNLRVHASATTLPSVAAYGFSCGPVLSATSAASLGQTLGLAMANLPVSTSLAFGAFGLSREVLGSLVLPMPLDNFGLQGCWLVQDMSLALTSPFVVNGASAAGGLQIPNALGLIGVQLYHQGWVMASGANTGGVVTSNGLRIRVGLLPPATITESFATTAFLDAQVSSGTWSNGARPGLIGGDGRHGSFRPEYGIAVSPTEFVWNTTSITISNSLNGSQYIVTDGRFFFTDFTLGAGVTIDFVGPVPPQIYVRGKADILGTIRLNGAAMTTFNARGVPLTTPGPFVAGQSGGAPGAGGGRGGNGGNEYQHLAPAPGPGTILPTAANHGQRGDSVQVLAGHAYAASAANTGGDGSPMNPSSTTMVYQPVTSPQQAPINLPQLIVYRSYFARGGGGGGFATVGGVGTSNAFNGISTALGNLGAAGAAGVAFNLFPYPPLNPTPGYSSLNHFVVGGSGGGGGGTHAFGTITVPTTADVFVAGAGGSGGGGAFALRAGNDLTVAGSASLQAKGGAGVQITGRDPGLVTANANWGVACPGGGGSGGSFLLQSGTDLAMAGTIDTRGGNGSSTGNIATGQFAVQSQAGAGATGFFRLEEGYGAVAVAGATFPAYNSNENTGLLSDRDAQVGCASLWRSATGAFPQPRWFDYELDVDSDGNGTIDITYTDTGAAGTQLANSPTGPVMIHFQGAQLTAGGQPIPGTIGPWREAIGSGSVPGIAIDHPNGFRFMLTFNRGLFPNCIVRALRVRV